MGYIKHLTIMGLKMFERLDIDFNKNMDILVGKNEAGKVQQLEAINIVLNCKHLVSGCIPNLIPKSHS